MIERIRQFPTAQGAELVLETAGPSEKIVCGVSCYPSLERHLETLDIRCPAEVFVKPNVGVMGLLYLSFESQGDWNCQRTPKVLVPDALRCIMNY